MSLCVRLHLDIEDNDSLSKIFEPFGHLQLFCERRYIGHGWEIRLRAARCRWIRIHDCLGEVDRLAKNKRRERSRGIRA